MGLRFRRSIKIAPGIRLNASRSGLGLSVGPRGSTVSFTKRGTYHNASAFGFSQRTRLDGDSRPPPAARLPAPSSSSAKVTIEVHDDGTLSIQRNDGVALTVDQVAMVRKQNKTAILGMLEKAATDLTEQVEALGKLHESIADGRTQLKFTPEPFTDPEPAAPDPPTLKKYSLFAKLFRSIRERVDATNDAMQGAYAAAVADHARSTESYLAAQRDHAKGQVERRRLYEVECLADTQAMEAVLAERLEVMSWPRETDVSFEIKDEGKTVVLDVDLPEIEDMPTKVPTVAARDFALKFKEMAATKVRELYMRHIHGVGLRLIGEVFHSLPKCGLLVISAYSQRPNSKTGRTEDEYLYSARVTREAWLKLDFDNLPDLSPVDAFQLFEARRTMSKTGVFKPVEPFTGAQE